MEFAVDAEYAVSAMDNNEFYMPCASCGLLWYPSEQEESEIRKDASR